jgi:vancomycin resistance protein YoaR
VAVNSRTLKISKLTVLAAGLLAGGAFATFKAYAGPKHGTIPAGVRVAGMDWSNMPTATARAELSGWAQARLTGSLPLEVKLPSGRTKKWTAVRRDLGGRIDIEGTVRAAESASDDQSAWEQFATLFGKPKAVEIEPLWSLDDQVARDYMLRKIAPAVLRTPKDARVKVKGDELSVVPEEPGVKLDVDKSLEILRQAIEKDDASPAALPLTTAAPRISSGDLESIEGEIGRYQTHYGESGNRRRNIETACSRINGTVLKPGDIFSYNKVVGPRDASSGYRLAPVIIRGRLEPGLGGGICQTSSTLYNAILMSGLKVVRRSHHAFPVHYLPAGRDATVAYGSIDFKFQNDSGNTIAIAAEGSGGRVLMRVFGKKTPGRAIRIERTNVSSWGAPLRTVTDRSLRTGRRTVVDKGHSGHRVKVWRVVKMNGQVARRELISSDYYGAIPRVIAVGAAPVPAAKQPSEQPAVKGTTPVAPPASGAAAEQS